MLVTVRYYVKHAGRTFPVELRERPGTPGAYVARVEGVEHEVEVKGDLVLIDGRVIPCQLEPERQIAHFRQGPATCTVTPFDPDLQAAEGTVSAGEIRAPMPGKLVEVHVAEGDRVEASACLAVIEAMKMQNELRAPARVRVERVHVRAGQAVEAGALLFDLVADAGDPEIEPAHPEQVSTDATAPSDGELAARGSTDDEPKDA